MIIRVVRMRFREDQTDSFLTLFNTIKHQIRHFPGCQHLELLRDLNQPGGFVTYSHWESADALEVYRQSDLFQTTWAATKALFAERATAFSVERIDVVP